jgi:DNA-binding IclR family transcriptional regulator
MAVTGDSPVESVDRALRVLQALAAAGPGGLQLVELSGELGLNKTTVHRTLGALRHRDFVAQEPTTGRYLLGPRAVALSEQFFREENLPALLHPALVALCAATDELVHLGVLSGVQVVYLDKVEPERPVRVWSAIGRRNWAVTTGLGRAMLAFRGIQRSVLDGYVDAVGGAVAVEHGHVWDELVDTRRRGYAVEVEENEPGIACVAVPLLRGGPSAAPAAPSSGQDGAGAPVAALSITAPVDRMSAARIHELYGQIQRVVPPLLPAGLSLPAP